VSQALLRLAEIAGDDSSFIERQAVGLWRDVARQEDDTVHLRKEKISGLPVALQRQLLRIAVAKVLGNTRDVEVNHIEAIRSLLNKPVGKRISLPHGITCWSEYNEIVIMLSQGSEHSRSSAGASPPQTLPLFLPCPFSALHGEFALRVPGEMLLPGWRVMASTVRERSVSPSLRGVGYRSSELSEAQPLSVIAGGAKQSQRSFVAEFDLHRAGTELFIRQRQPGDRFQPLGMNMLKKLQDFMVDAKIPFSWRERIPLVCSPRQIIWIVGWRIDDRVKITEASKEILRLEFVKSL
jgi:tRNA(Ile)-lysidine synthase